MMPSASDLSAGERDKGLWRQDLPGLGSIFLCAFVIVLPLIVRGNSFGHDFDFHLLSWMETARQWHEGVLYPHWLPSANYGAGEPRFIFYPPASWMLGALIGILTNWAATPIIYIFVSLFFSGVSLYYLARDWMPRDAATLAACVYAVNPYAIFSGYERSAYGELLAGAWMPLILLFALRRRSSIVPLALTVAATWLTNAPAAVMACYTLAAVSVAIAMAERRAWPLVRATIGGLLGLGLASFYLIPAAYERRWVQIARAIGPGMRVEDSFLFARGGEAFHVAVLRSASIVSVVLLAATMTALAIVWRRSRDSVEPTIRRVLAGSSLITVAVFFLLLRWSEPIWRIAPEMKFLQFPWRWLLLQSVVMAVLTGLAMKTLSAGTPHRQILRRRLVVLACAALMAGAAVSAFYQSEDDDDTLAGQISAFSSGVGVEGTDEYTPQNADNSAIQGHLPPLRLLSSPQSDVVDSSSESNPNYLSDGSGLNGKITVDLWQSEHKVIRVATEMPGFAVLRLMDYPGWRVLLNASLQTARPQREDGLMVMPLPSGTSRIEVSWQETQDEIWGRMTTLVSLFLLVPIAWIEQRRTPSVLR